jgi:hypothetical protein
MTILKIDLANPLSLYSIQKAIDTQDVFSITINEPTPG